MAGFVLFDTQMIMEKRRNGSTDCIKHSMELFFDLVSMFRHLLIILTQKVTTIESINGTKLLITLFFFFVCAILQEEREQRRRKNK